MSLNRGKIEVQSSAKRKKDPFKDDVFYLPMFLHGGGRRGQIFDRNMMLHDIEDYVPFARTGGSLTPTKAREILHDGTVHGKPITEKQRKYFGYISNLKHGGMNKLPKPFWYIQNEKQFFSPVYSNIPNPYDNGSFKFGGFPTFSVFPQQATRAEAADYGRPNWPYYFAQFGLSTTTPGGYGAGAATQNSRPIVNYDPRAAGDFTQRDDELTLAGEEYRPVTEPWNVRREGDNFGLFDFGSSEESVETTPSFNFSDIFNPSLRKGGTPCYKCGGGYRHMQFNEGGNQSDFNNPHYFEDNQNGFTEWLRNQAMDATVDQMSGYHMMPDGSMMPDYMMRYGGGYRKKRKKVKKAKHGGYPLQGYDREEVSEIMEPYHNYSQEAYDTKFEEIFGYPPQYKAGGQKKNWVQGVTASIKRRGTEGVCTGSKFGGPTCPPGSKRYNLAKLFRKWAKRRKKQEGGVADLSMLNSLEAPMSTEQWVEFIQSNEGVELANQYGMTPDEFYQSFPTKEAFDTTQAQEELGEMDMGGPMMNPMSNIDMYSQAYNQFRENSDVMGALGNFANAGLAAYESNVPQAKHGYQNSIIEDPNNPGYYVSVRPGYTAPGYTGPANVPVDAYETSAGTAGTYGSPYGSYGYFPANTAWTRPKIKLRGFQGATFNFPGTAGASSAPVTPPTNIYEAMKQAGVQRYKARFSPFTGAPSKIKIDYRYWQPEAAPEQNIYGPGYKEHDYSEDSRGTRINLPKNVGRTIAKPFKKAGEGVGEAVRSFMMKHSRAWRKKHGPGSEGEKFFKYGGPLDQYQGGGPELTGLQAPDYNPYMWSTPQMTPEMEEQKRREEQVAGIAPITMDPLQMEGSPYGQDITGSIKYKPGRPRMADEDLVNWTLAGMAGITSIANARETQKREKDLRRRFKAENIFASSQTRDRGDYTPNYGYFRPDQMSTGRYITGKHGGQKSYELGGEYEMTNEEIQELRNGGYEIEFI